MLIARLGLDTREYEGGLNRTDAITNKWVHKQEKFLMKSFFHAFGIGAALHEINKAFEDADRISKEPGKHGLSPERFQALESVAKSTGLELEAMVEHLKDLPPEISNAVSEFEAMGKAIPSERIANLREMMKAGTSAGQAGETAIGGLMSGLWTGIKRMGFWSLGTADLMIGNLLGGWNPAGRKMLDSSDFWLQALQADALGMTEGEATTDRLTQILSLKKIKRAEAAEKAAARSPLAISPFHPEFFDALNKMGGFAQRGDTTISTPLERIAKATEATAENTRSGGSPY